jgi:asparagine synthase (glutamine-hydrolysing)
VPGHPLVVNYLGCSGRMRLPSGGVPVEHECVAFNDADVPGHSECYVRQWVNPAAAASDGLPQPVAGARLLLSGAPGEPCSEEFVERIVRAVTSGHYESLTQVEGELAGCVVTNEKVILFRNLASGDVLFYRRSGPLIEWSTNPADLLHDPLTEIDRERIWRSCRGDSLFVYRGLDFVRPGQLVVVKENSTRTVWYERLTPLDLPRRTTLRDYAAITYDLLVQAARPYANSGHVGILLSGGIDSSLVLAALVDSGADVTAYHIGTDDPLADESGYACEVCRQLSVPVVSVTTNVNQYFSTEGDFPHPYNHVWFHRTAEIADRIQRDGVTLLASGRDGDILFGPDHYGLHDILVGDVSWREKWQMALGLLCYPWELRHIVNSIRPSYSLIDDPDAVMLGERPVDFLVPMPNVPYESGELGFWPQELTLNLTVWRPRGIYCSCPMGSKDLRRLAMRLPDAYRLITYRGRMITKPVLRLAGSTRLPATTWRHYGIPWLASPDETWCLRHAEIISDLLGGPDSRLIEMGIVDPVRLAAVLADPTALRRNAETLVCSAMTELFLRSLEKRTPHRVWS